ncbi:Sphingolipid C4-hydroxylase sur2 [Marasmius tenuissimus]|uniref:Sphingolipid C4-hydroxylase sur2 n=1 Tax=Marasmius tenuissimus TaxID=585030 RepID=A0ABR3A1C2_9AGAR
MTAPNATSCALYDGNPVCFTFKDVPFYYSPKEHLVEGYSDPILALAAPIIAYWVASLFFHFLDTSNWKWLERYRIHESAEVKSRNLASVSDVIYAVIFQQVLQTVLGYFWIEDHGNHVHQMAKMQEWARTLAPYILPCVEGQLKPKLLHDSAYWVYWWVIPSAQFFGAMFVIDTWQYFLHRFMHVNKWFYKHLHSVHHRLYVPYAFGALYNHPVEGFVLDTLGAVIAEAVTGMTSRQALVLFAVSSLKTVDDHCGYRFPLDPLQLLTSNNADYHDIHHQIIGIKSNFAQPFFVHWDTILGTRMTRAEFEARKAKSRKAQ